MNTCGARKPGWEQGPPIGRNGFPCVLPTGREGHHRDGLGQTWAAAVPMRRLPWNGENGGPAYLSTDTSDSLLAVMADNVEDAMIDNAEAVLEFARELLAGDVALTADELAYTAHRLRECLADMLNVANMRGERLDGTADIPLDEPLVGQAAAKVGQVLRTPLTDRRTPTDRD